MDVLEIIKKGCQFWEYQKVEKVAKKFKEKQITIIQILLIYFVLFLINSFLSNISNSFYFDDFVFGENTITIFLSLTSYIFFTTLSVLFFYAIGWWNYIFIQIFEGKGDFKKTFKILSIIQIPFYLSLLVIELFMLIKIIFLSNSNVFNYFEFIITILYVIAFIYSCVITVKTLQITHKMSRKNAIFAILSSFVLLCILIGGILSAFFIFIFLGSGF